MHRTTQTLQSTDAAWNAGEHLLATTRKTVTGGQRTHMFAILMAIWHRTARGQVVYATWLADWFMTNYSTISEHVTKLERLGYIARKQTPPARSKQGVKALLPIPQPPVALLKGAS